MESIYDALGEVQGRTRNFNPKNPEFRFRLYESEIKDLTGELYFNSSKFESNEKLPNSLNELNSSLQNQILFLLDAGVVMDKVLNKIEGNIMTSDGWRERHI